MGLSFERVSPVNVTLAFEAQRYGTTNVHAHLEGWPWGGGGRWRAFQHRLRSSHEIALLLLCPSCHRPQLGPPSHHTRKCTTQSPQSRAVCSLPNPHCPLYAHSSPPTPSIVCMCIPAHPIPRVVALRLSNLQRQMYRSLPITNLMRVLACPITSVVCTCNLSNPQHRACHRCPIPSAVNVTVGTIPLRSFHSTLKAWSRTVGGGTESSRLAAISQSRPPESAQTPLKWIIPPSLSTQTPATRAWELMLPWKEPKVSAWATIGKLAGSSPNTSSVGDTDG